jgi:hypothetical protein
VGLASVDQPRAWQQQISHSTLLVLPGDPSMSRRAVQRCSKAPLDFIEHRPGAA